MITCLKILSEHNKMFKNNGPVKKYNTSEFIVKTNYKQCVSVRKYTSSARQVKIVPEQKNTQGKEQSDNVDHILWSHVWGEFTPLLVELVRSLPAK